MDLYLWLQKALPPLIQVWGLKCVSARNPHSYSYGKDIIPRNELDASPAKVTINPLKSYSINRTLLSLSLVSGAFLWLHDGATFATLKLLTLCFQAELKLDIRI